MKKIENRCIGCATESYPCRGSSCPYRHTEVTYCDHCGEEIYYEDVCEVDGNHYHPVCHEELFGKEEEE